MKGLMKKITGAIASAMLLLCPLSMAATAAETETAKEVQAFETMGIDLALPEDLQNTKGLLIPAPFGQVDVESHFYLLGFLYTAMPEEEAVSMLSNAEISGEEMEKITARQTIMMMLITSDLDLEDAKKKYHEIFGENSPVNIEMAEEVGTADGYHFYAVSGGNEAYLASLDEEFAEDYRIAEQLLLEAARNAVFYAPQDAARDLPGQKLVFTTVDMQGNTVTSEELFSQNRITMINCWGLWCPNCMNEMEELVQIHSRMQEKGCGIVGFEWEQDEEMYKDAEETLEQYGTDYPCVLMPEEMIDYVHAFPTSVFVDSEGTVLSEPIVGAAVSEYEKALEEILAGMSETSSDSEASETGENTAADAASDEPVTYKITVTDGDGPVEEVVIQICTDTSCTMQETDEDGMVCFDGTAGEVYEIHVLEAPEEYQEDENTYELNGDAPEVNIQLEKS